MMLPEKSWALLIALSLTALVGCQNDQAPVLKPQKVVVFHAASLTRLFTELKQQMKTADPPLDLQLEFSGSQVAARKVTELGRRPDLVALADAWLIDVMMSQHTGWRLTFATNEVVLAHGPHSPHTTEVTGASWADYLTRDDVRLGRTDPETSPIGYRTLFVWTLAEEARSASDKKSGKEPAREGWLVDALKARCAPEHVVPDEAQLLSLLQTRSIDYAFVYRSTAHDHHLKWTELPVEINLGRAELADRYRKAWMPIRTSGDNTRQSISGAPILYGLTIPRAARNRSGGEQLVRYLLGPEGMALLEQVGFRPVTTPQLGPGQRLPESLQDIEATETPEGAPPSKGQVPGGPH